MFRTTKLCRLFRVTFVHVVIFKDSSSFDIVYLWALKEFTLSKIWKQHSFRLYSSLFVWISESFSKKLKTYSCVNQLLTITPDIFSSFNDNCEVRGIFANMKWKMLSKNCYIRFSHKLKTQLDLSHFSKPANRLLKKTIMYR